MSVGSINSFSEMERMKAAVRQDGRALRYVSETLREDRGLALEAVRKNKVAIPSKDRVLMGLVIPILTTDLKIKSLKRLEKKLRRHAQSRRNLQTLIEKTSFPAYRAFKNPIGQNDYLKYLLLGEVASYL